MNRRRIAVVGSRKHTHPEQVYAYLDNAVRAGDEIVSGGAVGVDSFAQEYAKNHGLVIHIHYPDYARFGRIAPLVRNKAIVLNSDVVLAFYTKGNVRKGGTANTIVHAINEGKPFFEIEEEDEDG